MTINKFGRKFFRKTQPCIPLSHVLLAVTELWLKKNHAGRKADVYLSMILVIDQKYCVGADFNSPL